MRRAVFLAVGVFELAAAALLVGLGLLLPAPDDVRASFDRVGRLTGTARRQVLEVRDEIRTVRHPQAGQLDAVRRANQSLGSLADGMEAWAAAFDPALLKQLGDGTTALATFLDGR